MAELNKPAELSTLIENLERRVRTLEGAPRLGLDRVRYAWATGTPQTVTTFDAWDFGPVGATWQDDQGATGTGYPKVTVSHGKKALFFVQGYAQQIAADATYKSSQWYLGVSGSGLPSITNPLMYRFQTHGPTSEGNNAVQVITGRSDLTPGTFLYGVMSQFILANALAVNAPKLADPFVLVVPIDR